MLKFYYAPRTCALATHLALEQTGAPYEAIALDFTNLAQRSAEYLALTPKGRVPALVTESGTLTETPALLLYLCQRYPEVGLAPLDDIFATAELQAFNSYLCSTVHRSHEEEGAAINGRLHGVDRERHVARPLGNGRALLGGRYVPVHDFRLAGRRWGGYKQVAARAGASGEDVEGSGGAKNQWVVRVSPCPIL